MQTCQFFSVKCVRFFVFTEPEFPKIYRRLPKIAKVFGRLPKIAEDFPRLPKSAEDFPMASEDNRRCRKIFNDFKTGPMISKGFPTNLEHCFEDILTTSRTFLSNYTRQCQLSARNWSECLRSQV